MRAQHAAECTALMLLGCSPGEADPQDRLHARTLAGPDEGDYAGELLPYITGEKKAPIPTYFIGGWGGGSKQALEALAGATGCWWWHGAY